MFVQQQSYSASAASLRNPQNLDFPMKVKVFLEILIPHAVLMYIEQQIKQKVGNNTFYMAHSIEEFVNLRKTPQGQIRSTNMFETSPLLQTLKHTFRFTESQLTQAHTLIYNSSLVMITNLKPLLSEQMDLRPSSYTSSSTSTSKPPSSSLKTLIYIRVTLSSHYFEVAQCRYN